MAAAGKIKYGVEWCWLRRVGAPCGYVVLLELSVSMASRAPSLSPLPEEINQRAKYTSRIIYCIGDPGPGR